MRNIAIKHSIIALAATLLICLVLPDCAYAENHQDTALCASCDSWFISMMPGEGLCPRCALKSDFEELKNDPDFDLKNLNQESLKNVKVLEEKIEEYERFVWAKPNLRWVNSN